MVDVAALALKVDSSEVAKASADLDRFAAASGRAAKGGASIASQSGSIARLVASVQSVDRKLSAIVGGLEKVNTALALMSKAGQGAAAANDNVARSLVAVDSHVIAYTQHLAGLARAQQDANAHVLAYRSSLTAIAPPLQQADAHVVAYRNSLGTVAETARTASTAIKFTAVEGLNASRQLADIGVTAASGMSPFLIALQQGPQLLDILQNKAVMTGTTTATVFRAAAASVLAAAAPFLPLIGLLALAAAGIAAMTAQANDDSGLKKYTTAMGYTKAEVKKLNAVTVTFGDTAKAVFQSALAAAAASLGLNAQDMAKTWDSFLDHIVTGTRAALAAVYAGIAGTKAYLGEIEKGGILGLGKMLIGQGDPNLLKKTYGKAYADGQKALDGIVAQARKNAQARQSAMAKDFYDKPKTPKGPKSDAEKLADIYAGATADIAAEKARKLSADLNSTAYEATRLEKSTSLLNAIQQKNIPVTDAVRKKVGELADEYARLKTSADVSEAINASNRDLDRQRSAVADQAKLVGLYGDALARATREQEAQQRLRDSLPKGEVVVMPNLTGGISDQMEDNARAQRLADLGKASRDAAYAMDLERNGLALTGQAAIAYGYVVDQLNDKKRAGIDLSPQEVAAIKAAGDAYAAQRYSIDRQAEALSAVRETTKGFFADWINGARQGSSVFKSFADSAVNSLNRIIDKLLDRTLDTFIGGIGFGNLLGGGPRNSSGLAGSENLFAKGGAFGTAQRFAKGGTFTNSVVTAPTLFRFAKGTKLGEMGENGPEGVLPLKRGPNGALGVQMHGGGKTSVRMGDYNPTFSFAGAIGLEGIAAMVRQGGEETYKQMRRDLQSLLQQLDADGSFAS